MSIVTSGSEALKKLIQSAGLDEKEKERLGQTVEKVIRSATRINHIVLGLKGMTKSSDLVPIEKKIISEIIAESIDYVDEKIKKCGVRIDFMGDINQQIFCRPVQISQVLVNLISNSCDALEGTNNPWIKVTVQTKLKENIVEISVTDSGLGISNEIAEKLSRPFFTTKGAERGTGLGLSISRSTAEEHQGELFLDRNCENTRFILRLPVQRKYSLAPAATV